MNNETNIINASNIENLNISEEELPNVISEQFKAITDIDKLIQEAKNRCNNAKETAESMIIAKTINKKDAINATQDAVRSIADAQSALYESQKMLFEYQQKMANGMRYLLVLGASSIAMNKVVIAELEAKLKQATKEQLSQKSREELINVIKLLREQESAFSKQDRMSEQISKHSQIINKHEDELLNINKFNVEQDNVNKKHNEIIKENTLRNEIQDNQIAAIVKKDIEQDTEIKRQSDVDIQHENELKKLKTLSYIGIGIGIVATILSIINIILSQ